VKLSLSNAILILIAGLLLVLTGMVMNKENAELANPVVLSGLAVEFLGTVWLVLSLHQRRKKKNT
jgi:apolipoprotein N-acyltransferase